MKYVVTEFIPDMFAPFEASFEFDSLEEATSKVKSLSKDWGHPTQILENVWEFDEGATISINKVLK